MISLVENELPEMRKIFENHQVVKAELFGSAADGDFSSSSDIDILVTFSEALPLLDYADNYFSLKDQLEHLLNRQVVLPPILATASYVNSTFELLSSELIWRRPLI